MSNEEAIAGNPPSTLSIEDTKFIHQCLEALCFRPKESILMNRGNEALNESYRFDVPESFIIDEFKGIHPESPGSNTTVLFINDLPKEHRDALVFVESHPRDETFSVFIPKHQRIATALLYILSEIRKPRQLIDYLVYLHDRCNPYLFNYVLGVIVLNRVNELKFIMPDYCHMFPELFINGESYNAALTAVNVEPTELRTIIKIRDQFTGQSGDVELYLNYFREDISLNLYHLVFNRLYPTDGPLAYVNRKRRGEIYFHVYHQLIARYNMERLANKVARVKRLHNFYEPIKECCFPKLNSKTTNSNWPGRMSECKMSDLDRPYEEMICDLSALPRWRDRLIEATDNGYMILATGEKIRIDNDSGIDCFGQAIQSSITSPNHKYYGNFGIMGLNFLGYINDPAYKHQEPYGVASDPSTTLRDPATMRWLALIVDIMQSYKMTLPKYTSRQLSCPGVKIKDLRVSTEYAKGVYKFDEFFTNYEYQLADITAGLDYSPRDTIKAEYRQLNHKPYNLNLTIQNDESRKKATVRIFLLPIKDEREETMIFSEQRKFAIELDKFRVTRE